MSSKYTVRDNSKSESWACPMRWQIVRARTSPRSELSLPEAAVDRLAEYCTPEMKDFMTSDGLPDRTALRRYLSYLASVDTSLYPGTAHDYFSGRLLEDVKRWWFSALRRNQPKEFEQLTQIPGSHDPHEYFWHIEYEGSVLGNRRAETWGWCREVIEFAGDSSYCSDDRNQAKALWSHHEALAHARFVRDMEARRDEEASAALAPTRLADSVKAHEEASSALVHAQDVRDMEAREEDSAWKAWKARHPALEGWLFLAVGLLLYLVVIEICSGIGTRLTEDQHRALDAEDAFNHATQRGR